MKKYQSFLSENFQFFFLNEIFYIFEQAMGSKLYRRVFMMRMQITCDCHTLDACTCWGSSLGTGIQDKYSLSLCISERGQGFFNRGSKISEGV